MAPVIKLYFEYTEKYKKDYGEKTIVLIQVGAFFEIYGMQKRENNEKIYFGSEINSISKICDLNITLKTKTTVDYNGIKYNVGMAGFRDYNLDKYLEKIIANGFTCVVFVQQQDNPSDDRILLGIFSIGTYFSNENKNNNDDENNRNLTNHILSIKIQKFNQSKSFSNFSKFLNNFKYNKKPNNIGNEIINNYDNIDNDSNNDNINNDSNKNINNTVINNILHSNIIIGLSSIDILTGYSNYIEYNKEWIDAPTTFDEVEKYISIYNPNETIILYNNNEFSLQQIKKIVNYMNIQSKIIRFIYIDNETNQTNKIKEKTINNKSRVETETETENNFETNIQKIAYYSSKQSNQINIFKKYLKEYTEIQSFLESHLLNDFECAKHSFCFLLEYLHLHDPNLNKHIQEPELYQEDKNLLLGNHSLNQLNILNDGRMKGHLSSVSSFLNKCVTPMGKRYFNHVLMNPITNVENLSYQYNLIDYIKQNYDNTFIFNNDNNNTNDNTKKISNKNKTNRTSKTNKTSKTSKNNIEFSFETIRNELSNCIDIEKIFRKANLQKINPFEIYQLYCSLNNIKKIFEYLNSINDFNNLYDSNISNNKNNNNNIKNKEYSFDNNIKNINLINDFINKQINIKNIEVKQKDINNYTYNFFLKGIHNDLDNLERKYMETFDKITSIKNFINEIIKNTENKPKNVEYCKLHETEKSGFCIKTTTTRFKKLEQYIQKTYSNNTEVNIKFNSSYDNQEYSFVFKPYEIKKTTKGKDVQIDSSIIDKLCSEYLKYELRMKELIREKFNIFINEFTKNYNIIFILLKVIKNIDIYITKGYLANKYNYCKPTINNNKKNSYIDAKQIRHILIEHLQSDEIYVPNDILLDNETQQGILLYGTNAVGKSSFIKSIGICVLLAQSGFFVPCKEFIYKPYTQIFTRILGNDNIFKGLSTFAVEMSELRSILKFSNENTLVLGDELCSGTEQGSAISIFLSGIKQLYNKNTTFIFATHMHEITDLPHIKSKKRLYLKHMSVYYDNNKDILIYDRKLKDGPGNNNYGLEVCKSLQLPNDFLEEAIQIRNELFIKERNLTQQKNSKYNSNKKYEMCEICGINEGVEIHHLQYQRNANDKGYINNFHKNHLANLSSICEKCHDKIHNENIELKKVKTSKGYKLFEM